MKDLLILVAMIVAWNASAWFVRLIAGVSVLESLVIAGVGLAVALLIVAVVRSWR